LKRKFVVPPFFQLTVSTPSVLEALKVPDPPVVELVHPVNAAVGLINLPDRALQVVALTAWAGLASTMVPMTRDTVRSAATRWGITCTTKLLPPVAL
jgi:hypothetical protein